MDTSSRLLETIDRLDAADDAAAFLRFVQDESHDPNELVYAVYHLLSKTQFRSAYLLATVLISKGIYNPFLSIALCLGGLIFKNPTHQAHGLHTLSSQAPALLESQPALHAHICSKILDPAVMQLLATALAHSDSEQVLHVLDILKAFVPQFRTIFDWDAPVPEFSLAAMRQRGEETKSRLIHYPQPPAGTPLPRRVLVVFRECVFPSKPWSRLSNEGPRMVAAMKAYGWQTDYYPLRGKDLFEEGLGIIEVCRQKQIELLFLDDDIMMKVAPLRTELIARLRALNPAMKIVGCLLDAWEPEPEDLKQSTALVDRVWTVDAPSRPIWADPAHAHKIIHRTFPHLAGNCRTPQGELTDQATFFGSLSGFNWHRVLWVSAFERAKLPVKSCVATHKEDGLSALDNYAAYMQSLAEEKCCINLTMRANQYCVVTFRSFETLQSGALLLQEHSENMYRYFIPGEHYLEFSTLAELAGLLRFVRTHREEAEAVRQRGNAFAREHYNDGKLIGCIEKSLYFPD
ncbi:MAG: glycosyltransferase family 1 protein [Magnetococcales bacterium]|nr:glycosyltransferase family 1 protein [Magnetococcales bacterium]